MTLRPSRWDVSACICFPGHTSHRKLGVQRPRATLSRNPSSSWLRFPIGPRVSSGQLAFVGYMNAIYMRTLRFACTRAVFAHRIYAGCGNLLCRGGARAGAGISAASRPRRARDAHLPRPRRGCDAGMSRCAAATTPPRSGHVMGASRA